MKKLAYIIILSSIAAMSGCGDCDIVCRTINNGRVIIKVTINSENPSVPFEIYEGKIERGTLVNTFTATQDRMEIVLPARTYYSIKATYRRGANEIIAVNGGELDVTTDDCGCERANALRLNVRLAR